MAFGGFDQGPQAPMSEINVTPLVDVMLVLLVIFLVTAPLFTHAVRVDLPNAPAQPAPEKPETIALSIDGTGRVYWNRAPVGMDELPARLAQAAQTKPQPVLRLYADRDTRYQRLAEVIAAAQNAGLARVAFVTDPSHQQRSSALSPR